MVRSRVRVNVNVRVRVRITARARVRLKVLLTRLTLCVLPEGLARSHLHMSSG